MKISNERGPLSPALLGGIVFLLAISNSRAVDPVDFLESLKDDGDLTSSLSDGSSTEYPNGVNVIPGEAEVNYPVYSTIPKSSFSCIGRPVGFYADTELRCQVWHICDEDRRQQSFLCTNGTVYSQEKRVCDWWYNVNCDPSEVSKNYLQNYDLYKGPPPKSGNEEEESSQNQERNSNNRNNDLDNNSKKNINEFDYQPTTKSSSRDQFYSQSRQPSESRNQPQRYNNNNEQYSKPTTPAYNEPSTRDASSFSNNNFQQGQSRRQNSPQPSRQPTTTTYRPPTTYSTVPPPAALQGSSFPPQRSHHQQQQKQHSPSTPAPPRSVPSQKTYNSNGKRIVEIRVPISQIPPEILAKYGKRIPENILKEIFLNFTRGQQQELQKEAIKDSKPSNPTGAGNSRSQPPKAPVSQARYSQPPSPPPPPPSHSHSQSKKPVDLGSIPNEYKPSFASSQPQPKSKSAPPPPPPPPQEPQQKFRHSTPRKVDNVKFATPTRELLADYDDERQVVGESQNPAYSLQQLFSSHHSRTFKSRGSPAANEVPREKESFTYEPTTTTTVQPFQQQPQEFTRSQPRRRTQTQGTTYRSTSTTTTEEPALITDRYVPVATKEEKKNAEVRRILLVARQGIQVLPPIPVLASQQEPLHPTPRRVPPTTQRPHIRRTTPFQEFSKIGKVPPPPKVAIPDDYYVKNERFQEAESRYPTPKVPSSYTEAFQQAYQRPTTTTTITTTTSTTTEPTAPPTPFFQEPEFRRTKPSKPQQHKKKALPPTPEAKKSDSSSDYDNDDGSDRENFNTDELELLRLAQEYIELTGQDFGIRKQPKNA